MLEALRIPPRPETVFGAGSAEALGGLVRGLGEETAFVVTDPGIVAAGVADVVCRHLARAGVRFVVHDAVGPNPSVGDVETGSLALRAAGPAAVVALGGGSAIDAAKAIALHAPNDARAAELEDPAAVRAPARPVIAVPTTAGTGAETNAFGVIGDPDAGRKRYLGHPSSLPRFAVLDPDLTLSAPPHVTAACGIDVLAHAIESLQARSGNAYSAALALEAVGIVVRHLPAVVRDGADADGRSAMLLASHLAGLAFGTTGLGTAHAIGHALSARYGTPHGVALAAVLPLVVRENGLARPEATVRIAAAAGFGDRAEAVPAAVAALQEQVGLRPSLADLGMPLEDADAIAGAALADAVVRNAPRIPSRAELTTLLQEAHGVGAPM